MTRISSGLLVFLKRHDMRKPKTNFQQIPVKVVKKIAVQDAEQTENEEGVTANRIKDVILENLRKRISPAPRIY